MRKTLTQITAEKRLKNRKAAKQSKINLKDNENRPASQERASSSESSVESSINRQVVEKPSKNKNYSSSEDSLINKSENNDSKTCDSDSDS